MSKICFLISLMMKPLNLDMYLKLVRPFQAEDLSGSVRRVEARPHLAGGSKQCSIRAAPAHARCDRVGRKGAWGSVLLLRGGKLLLRPRVVWPSEPTCIHRPQISVVLGSVAGTGSEQGPQAAAREAILAPTSNLCTQA